MAAHSAGSAAWVQKCIRPAMPDRVRSVGKVDRIGADTRAKEKPGAWGRVNINGR